jgi:AcrR family transcriptional regulator
MYSVREGSTRRGGVREPIWTRPEHAAVGRPAERSRAEITTAAIAVADRDGLAAVSMRRVAAELDTGAASLYRYLGGRDDLLDLMVDATGAEYELAPPTGDWLADLVAVGTQARAIMRRHPWLPALLSTRAGFGPHGVDLLEHVLSVLADHPADAATKLEAFAVLNAATAMFAQAEAAGPAAPEERARQVAYLHSVAAAGRHPRLAELLAAAAPPAEDADRFPGLLARILAGLLGGPD